MPRPQQPMILMLISDALERLHAALSLATTAAASGRDVTLYLTGPSVALLRRDGLAALSHSDGRSYPDVTADQAAKGLADIGLLLDALAALPVRVLVCDSALVEAGLTTGDLVTSPASEASGYASLMAHASDLAEATGTPPAWLTF